MAQTVENIYYHEGSLKDCFEKILVNDSYVQGIEYTAVHSLVTIITTIIKNFQTSQMTNRTSAATTNDIMNGVFVAEDITFTCVDISEWKRGYCFVFLQISKKNGGSARLALYTTDTIHPSAVGFDTMVESEETSKPLNKYLSNDEKIINDLNRLKMFHATTKIAETLKAEMSY